MQQINSLDTSSETEKTKDRKTSTTPFDEH